MKDYLDMVVSVIVTIACVALIGICIRESSTYGCKACGEQVKYVDNYCKHCGIQLRILQVQDSLNKE